MYCRTLILATGSYDSEDPRSLSNRMEGIKQHLELSRLNTFFISVLAELVVGFSFTVEDVGL